MPIIYEMFSLRAPYNTTQSQDQIIQSLVDGCKKDYQHQTLLGVTGCGKTFIMANIIKELQKPAIIIAPNKILAAQLFEEFKAFFPNNAVEFFVSYYDYYQPEAYVPGRDLYIEKDSSINDHLDQMRLSATKAILERRDVVIVASVSSLYGLGNPETYQTMLLHITEDQHTDVEAIIARLIAMQYSRNDIDFKRGTFRVRGFLLDIYPAEHEEIAIRITFSGEKIKEIATFDPFQGRVLQTIRRFTFYPKSHYVAPRDHLHRAMIEIKKELQLQITHFTESHKLLEAQRIEQRTMFDLEMMSEMGFCTGIENYSRHLTGRVAGDPPPCLFDYIPADGLLFIDESHITVPQLGAMYKGDRSRKKNLVDYGFRLPSALDNRPLQFEEFEKIPQTTIYISATPAEYEYSVSKQVVELVLRPTGLLDPKITIMPAQNQIELLIDEIKKERSQDKRVLVGCLTKRMSEQVSSHLTEYDISARFMHADTSTIDRMRLIHDLRIGSYQVLVGINLLREGLDLPEVGLVALLDADRQGFLRSERSLIQTMGRAARNLDGRVILFADSITPAMARAIAVSEHRREIQRRYNQENNITPSSTVRPIIDLLANEYNPHAKTKKSSEGAPPVVKSFKNISDLEREIGKCEKQMIDFAQEYKFEKAIEQRDRLKQLKTMRVSL